MEGKVSSRKAKGWCISRQPPPILAWSLACLCTNRLIRYAVPRICRVLSVVINTERCEIVAGDESEHQFHPRENMRWASDVGAVLKMVKEPPEPWGNFLEKGNGLESQGSFPGPPPGLKAWVSIEGMGAEGTEGSEPSQPAGLRGGTKASQMRHGRWDQSCGCPQIPATRVTISRAGLGLCRGHRAMGSTNSS